MKSLFLIAFFLLFPPTLFAQEIGFMGIQIGMTRRDVLETADANEIIEVPKNRDVDFFPVEERKIITLSIKPEIPFIYLQFYDEKLYAITVIFNEKYIDYFMLSDALQEKYGEYTAVHPEWRQWQLDNVTVKVEKPAVVKYIALEEFLEVTAFDGSVDQIGENRRKFLLDGL